MNNRIPETTVRRDGAGVDRLAGGLFRRAALRILSRWRFGRLEVRLPEGHWITCGAPGAEPVVRAHVVRERAFRRLLTGGEIGAGESYVDGDWWAEDLPAFLALTMKNVPRRSMNGGAARISHLWNAILHHRRGNTKSGSRRNIRAHYDLGNAFYRLFLDESMTYSSALFREADESLEDAQARKLDAIIDRIDLTADHHVLELGCGWGSFAIRAARRTGCRVTGVTLSTEQQALARERIRAAGLSDRIDIRLVDYRDVEGAFDRIVSIEMFEAVGFAWYDTFFAACDRLLKPGGSMFLQTITIPDRDFHRYRLKSDWIRKHVFPGSLLASVDEVMKSLARATSLSLESFREIGPHYALTLREWRTRYHRRQNEVRALGCDERFLRLWDYYLAGCEAAFDTGVIGNAQIVLSRSAERGAAVGEEVE